MNVIGRLFFELVKVLLDPCDGFLKTLVKANTVLPTEGLASFGAVEEVGGVLAWALADHVHSLIELRAQTLAETFDQIPDGIFSVVER
jgi:hypothetical protein